jgi:hypothetical protein
VRAGEGFLLCKARNLWENVITMLYWAVLLLFAKLEASTQRKQLHQIDKM